MDSLFANYASSDEEDGQKESGSSNPPPKIDAKSTSKTLFSSLPPPKSSSSSSSSSVFPLPQPKSHLTNSSSPSPLIANPSLQDAVGSQPEASHPKPSADLFSSLPQPKSSSSLFSSLPQPKTQNTDPFNLSPMVPAKRVVQFRPPPINPPSSNGAGSDDDEDENEAKPKKNQETIQTSKQSLWSIMPAPKNSATLGASSSASGRGRRSIIDAAIPGMKNASVANTATDGEAGVGANKGYYEGESIVDQSSSSSGGVNESTGYMYGGNGGDYSNWAPGAEENYAGNGGGVGYEGVSGDYQSGDYVNYGRDYADHGHYQSNRVDDSTSSMVPGMSGLAGSAFKLPGKRGRKDVEIVEVKQDELIKNRPREDQVKLTGIAFGPSYQPTTTKGKPSKLHKRKHQIGSLYFDMKQKEMELAERRSRGLLTKSQTQGKYGW